MKSEIKALHSPDIENLEEYVPSVADCFGFLLQVIAGPQGEKGEESFDLIVCTPKWLAIKVPLPLIARHYLIVKKYDYDDLKQFLQDYCAKCTGKDWNEIAEKLGRIGKWEFEDYHQ